MLGVAGDLRRGGLRFAGCAEGVVDLGADGFHLALRLAALLPFVADPEADRKTDDARDRDIQQRVRIRGQLRQRTNRAQRARRAGEP